MKYIILIILIIVISYFFINNKKQIKQNLSFLYSTCEKGICYEHLDKCYSPNGYQYVNGSSDDKKIERKTFKCILEPNDKYKLIKLENIFIPSMMDGTFCDIVYSTYYDYNDLTVLKNRIYNLNMPLCKSIRIRKYHFNPKTYLEIKYSGGTKIRAEIDKYYNILGIDTLEEENREIIVNTLDKIKNKKINPIFNNTYKRLSFIYKHDPSMRITIDTNIEFFKNQMYNIMDKDILEFKIPNSVSIGEVTHFLKEINMSANTKLQFTNFSKFEYYYYDVISK